MTTPTGKKSSGELAKPIVQKRPPNKMTLGIPHKYVEPTKAEMYEDLRKAVENTK